MICDAVSGHSHVHRTEHHVMSCQGMSNPCLALPSSLRPLACTSVLFMMSCSLSLTSRGINVLTLLRVFTFSLSKVQKRVHVRIVLNYASDLACLQVAEPNTFTSCRADSCHVLPYQHESLQMAFVHNVAAPINKASFCCTDTV